MIILFLVICGNRGILNIFSGTVQASSTTPKEDLHNQTEAVNVFDRVTIRNIYDDIGDTFTVMNSAMIHLNNYIPDFKNYCKTQRGQASSDFQKTISDIVANIAIHIKKVSERNLNLMHCRMKQKIFTDTLLPAFREALGEAIIRELNNVQNEVNTSVGKIQQSRKYLQDLNEEVTECETGNDTTCINQLYGKCKERIAIIKSDINTRLDSMAQVQMKIHSNLENDIENIRIENIKKAQNYSDAIVNCIKVEVDRADTNIAIWDSYSAINSAVTKINTFRSEIQTYCKTEQEKVSSELQNVTNNIIANISEQVKIASNSNVNVSQCKLKHNVYNSTLLQAFIKATSEIITNEVNIFSNEVEKCSRNTSAYSTDVQNFSFMLSKCNVDATCVELTKSKCDNKVRNINENINSTLNTLGNLQKKVTNMLHDKISNIKNGSIKEAQRHASEITNCIRFEIKIANTEKEIAITIVALNSAINKINDYVVAFKNYCKNKHEQIVLEIMNTVDNILANITGQEKKASDRNVSVMQCTMKKNIFTDSLLSIFDKAANERFTSHLSNIQNEVDESAKEMSKYGSNLKNFVALSKKCNVYGTCLNEVRKRCDQEISLIETKVNATLDNFDDLQKIVHNDLDREMDHMQNEITKNVSEFGVKISNCIKIELEIEYIRNNITNALIIVNSTIIKINFNVAEFQNYGKNRQVQALFDLQNTINAIMRNITDQLKVASERNANKIECTTDLHFLYNTLVPTFGNASEDAIASRTKKIQYEVAQFVSEMNIYSTALQKYNDKLGRCSGDITCVKVTKAECKKVIEDMKANTSTTLDRFVNLQKNLQSDLENEINKIKKVKLNKGHDYAKQIHDCIINELIIIDITNHFADTIKALNLTYGKMSAHFAAVENYGRMQQQQALSVLQNTTIAVLANITNLVREATKLDVNVIQCTVKEELFYESLLPAFVKETNEVISSENKILKDEVENFANKLNKYVTDLRNYKDIIVNCSGDATCVNIMQAQCDDEIKSIKSDTAILDRVSDLQKKIENNVANKISNIKNISLYNAYNYGNNISKCIETKLEITKTEKDIADALNTLNSTILVMNVYVEKIENYGKKQREQALFELQNTINNIISNISRQVKDASDLNMNATQCATMQKIFNETLLSAFSKAADEAAIKLAKIMQNEVDRSTSVMKTYNVDLRTTRDILYRCSGDPTCIKLSKAKCQDEITNIRININSTLDHLDKMQEMMQNHIEDEMNQIKNNNMKCGQDFRNKITNCIKNKFKIEDTVKVIIDAVTNLNLTLIKMKDHIVKIENFGKKELEQAISNLQREVDATNITKQLEEVSNLDNNISQCITKQSIFNTTVLPTLNKTAENTTPSGVASIQKEVHKTAAEIGEEKLNLQNYNIMSHNCNIDITEECKNKTKVKCDEKISTIRKYINSTIENLKNLQKDVHQLVNEMSKIGNENTKTEKAYENEISNYVKSESEIKDAERDITDTLSKLNLTIVKMTALVKSYGKNDEQQALSELQDIINGTESKFMEQEKEASIHQINVSRSTVNQEIFNEILLPEFGQAADEEIGNKLKIIQSDIDKSETTMNKHGSKLQDISEMLNNSNIQNTNYVEHVKLKKQQDFSTVKHNTDTILDSSEKLTTNIENSLENEVENAKSKNTKQDYGYGNKIVGHTRSVRQTKNIEKDISDTLNLLNVTIPKVKAYVTEAEKYGKDQQQKGSSELQNNINSMIVTISDNVKEASKHDVNVTRCTKTQDVFNGTILPTFTNATNGIVASRIQNLQDKVDQSAAEMTNHTTSLLNARDSMNKCSGNTTCSNEEQPKCEKEINTIRTYISTTVDSLNELAKKVQEVLGNEMEKVTKENIEKVKVNGDDIINCLKIETEIKDIGKKIAETFTSLNSTITKIKSYTTEIKNYGKDQEKQASSELQDSIDNIPDNITETHQNASQLGVNVSECTSKTDVLNKTIFPTFVNATGAIITIVVEEMQNEVNRSLKKMERCSASLQKASNMLNKCSGNNSCLDKAKPECEEEIKNVKTNIKVVVDALDTLQNQIENKLFRDVNKLKNENIKEGKACGDDDTACIKTSIEVKDLQKKIADTFTSLNSSTSNIRAHISEITSYGKDQDDQASSELQNVIENVLDKITESDQEASKLLVNVTQCTTRKNVFNNTLLPTFINTTGEAVNTAIKQMQNEVNGFLEKMEKLGTGLQEASDMLNKCDGNDTCLKETRPKCEEEINDVATNTKTAKEALSKLEQQVKHKINRDFNKIKDENIEKCKEYGDEITSCIQAEIELKGIEKKISDSFTAINSTITKISAQAADVTNYVIDQKEQASSELQDSIKDILDEITGAAQEASQLKVNATQCTNRNDVFNNTILPTFFNQTSEAVTTVVKQIQNEVNGSLEKLEKYDAVLQQASNILHDCTGNITCINGAKQKCEQEIMDVKKNMKTAEDALDMLGTKIKNKTTHDISTIKNKNIKESRAHGNEITTRIRTAKELTVIEKKIKDIEMEIADASVKINSTIDKMQDRVTEVKNYGRRQKEDVTYVIKSAIDDVFDNIKEKAYNASSQNVNVTQCTAQQEVFNKTVLPEVTNAADEIINNQANNFQNMVDEYMTEMKKHDTKLQDMNDKLHECSSDNLDCVERVSSNCKEEADTIQTTVKNFLNNLDKRAEKVNNDTENKMKRVENENLKNVKNHGLKIINCINIAIQTENIKKAIAGALNLLNSTIATMEGYVDDTESDGKDLKKQALSELQNTIDKIQVNITRKVEEATKSEVNVTQCKVNQTTFNDTLLPEFDRTTNEVIESQTKIIKDEVNKSTKYLNSYADNLRKINASLQNCSNEDINCISTVNTQCTEEIKAIKEDVNATLQHLDELEEKVQSELEKKIKNCEEDQIKAGKQYGEEIINCIEVATKVKNIGADTANALTLFNTTITKMNNYVTKLKKLGTKQQNQAAFELQNTIDDVLSNITNLANDATQHNVNVTRCTIKQNIFNDALLPAFRNASANKITTQTNMMQSEVNHSLDAMNDDRTDLQSANDVLHKCNIEDNACVDEAVSKCTQQIETIKANINTTLNNLDKLKQKLENELKTRMETLQNENVENANRYAYEIIICIKIATELDNTEKEITNTLTLLNSTVTDMDDYATKVDARGKKQQKQASLELQYTIENLIKNIAESAEGASKQNANVSHCTTKKNNLNNTILPEFQKLSNDMMARQDKAMQNEVEHSKKEMNSHSRDLQRLKDQLYNCGSEDFNCLNSTSAKCYDAIKNVKASITASLKSLSLRENEIENELDNKLKDIRNQTIKRAEDLGFEIITCIKIAIKIADVINLLKYTITESKNHVTKFETSAKYPQKRAFSELEGTIDAILANISQKVNELTQVGVNVSQCTVKQNAFNSTLLPSFSKASDQLIISETKNMQISIDQAIEEINQHISNLQTLDGTLYKCSSDDTTCLRETVSKCEEEIETAKTYVSTTQGTFEKLEETAENGLEKKMKNLQNDNIKIAMDYSNEITSCLDEMHKLKNIQKDIENAFKLINSTAAGMNHYVTDVKNYGGNQKKEGVYELENNINGIRSKIADEAEKASKQQANVTQCKMNQDYFNNTLVPGFNKAADEAIDYHSKNMQDQVTNAAGEVNKQANTLKDVEDTIHNCKSQDSICISNAISRCEEQIKSIKSNINSTLASLDSKRQQLQKELGDKLTESRRGSIRDAVSYGADIMTCIRFAIKIRYIEKDVENTFLAINSTIIQLDNFVVTVQISGKKLHEQALEELKRVIDETLASISERMDEAAKSNASLATCLVRQKVFGDELLPTFVKAVNAVVPLQAENMQKEVSRVAGEIKNYGNTLEQLRDMLHKCKSDDACVSEAKGRCEEEMRNVRRNINDTLNSLDVFEKNTENAIGNELKMIKEKSVRNVREAGNGILNCVNNAIVMRNVEILIEDLSAKMASTLSQMNSYAAIFKKYGKEQSDNEFLDLQIEYNEIIKKIIGSEHDASNRHFNVTQCGKNKTIFIDTLSEKFSNSSDAAIADKAEILQQEVNKTGQEMDKFKRDWLQLGNELRNCSIDDASCVNNMMIKCQSATASISEYMNTTVNMFAGRRKLLQREILLKIQGLHRESLLSGQTYGNQVLDCIKARIKFQMAERLLENANTIIDTAVLDLKAFIFGFQLKGRKIKERTAYDLQQKFNEMEAYIYDKKKQAMKYRKHVIQCTRNKTAFYNTIVVALHRAAEDEIALGVNSLTVEMDKSLKQLNAFREVIKRLDVSLRECNSEQLSCVSPMRDRCEDEVTSIKQSITPMMLNLESLKIRFEKNLQSKLVTWKEDKVHRGLVYRDQIVGCIAARLESSSTLFTPNWKSFSFIIFTHVYWNTIQFL